MSLIDQFGAFSGVAPPTVQRPRAGSKRKYEEIVKKALGNQRAQNLQKLITETITQQMKRTFEDGGDYQQLAKVVDRFGSRLSKTERLLKCLGAHQQRYIERFQKCNTGSATSGAYNLSYYNRPGSQDYVLPVYLFDLTCVPNNVYRSDTAALTEAQPFPFRRLHRKQSTAAAFPQTHSYYTLPQTGTDSEGVATSTWGIEERSTATYSVGTSTMINWCDIRMMIYGASGRPSRVRVDLIQFTDDSVCPTAGYSSGGFNFTQSTEPSDGDGFNQEYKEWHDMWTNWCSSLIGNPIAKRGTGKKSPINVLYSKTFKFNPTSNTESDLRGHQCEFHLHYNMDKVHSYDQGGDREVLVDIDPGAGVINDAVPQLLAAEMVDPNKWSNNDRSLNSCFTAGRGRTYLVISGMTMEQNGPDADTDAAKAASFDLIVRRKRVQYHV